MVGQASSLSVGAHGCAPFVGDRQDAGPPQDASRHQILSFFAFIFENPYKPPFDLNFKIEAAQVIVEPDLVLVSQLGTILVFLRLHC